MPRTLPNVPFPERHPTHFLVISTWTIWKSTLDHHHKISQILWPRLKPWNHRQLQHYYIARKYLKKSKRLRSPTSRGKNDGKTQPVEPFHAQVADVPALASAIGPPGLKLDGSGWLNLKTHGDQQKLTWKRRTNLPFLDDLKSQKSVEIGDGFWCPLYPHECCWIGWCKFNMGCEMLVNGVV